MPPTETASEIVVDPRAVRSRAAIVAAATEHFLERGYLAANMDDVARAAGVSKRTIYNNFDGKEQLFREILAGALQTAERYSQEVAASLAETDDVEADLRAAGLQLARSLLLTGRIVPLRRLLIGEAARFPELADEYYARAPGRVMANFASSFRRLGARGLLHVDDPELAAEHFAFLVLGASLDRALFDGGGKPPPTGVVERRAVAGVDAFLRAYAPGRDRSDG